MTHASKDLLIALADGELSRTAEARALRHLDECSACAAKLAEVQETRASFAAVLGAVDGGEPAAWALAADRLPDLLSRVDEDDATYADAGDADVVDIRRGRASRAARRDEAARSATGRPRTARSAPRRSAPPAWRWAAGILLAGAAAAAVLREPLANALRGGDAPEVAVTTVAAPPQTPPGGVFVTPVDGAAEIELANGAEGTRIWIASHDRAEILVEATSDDTPQFRPMPGHLRADLAGARHDLRIVVPVGVREVRIVADGAVLAVIEEGRLTRPGTHRGYVIEAEPTGR